MLRHVQHIVVGFKIIHKFTAPHSSSEKKNGNLWHAHAALVGLKGHKNLVALKITTFSTAENLERFFFPTLYYSSAVSFIKVPGMPNYTS